MYTRCTHCDALFRVTLHQLQSSSGQVRCGLCLQVFDAFRYLSASEPVEPAPQDAPASVDDDSDRPALTDGSPEAEPAPGVAAATAWAEFPPDAEPLPSFPAEDVPAPAAVAASADVPIPAELEEGFVFHGEDGVDSPGPSGTTDLDFMLESETVRADIDVAVAAPDEARVERRDGTLVGDETGYVPEALVDRPSMPEGEERAPAPSRRHYLGWGATALLVCTLPIQSLIFFRDDIALRIPSVRPALASMCRTFGCQLPLPKLSDRLVIEASELQALDPARPHRVVLIATLRNTAAVPQAFPMLELTLTDTREQISGRKVFSPEDYLPAGTLPETGLDADADIDIRMYLDTGTVDANGYRLFIYHP